MKKNIISFAIFIFSIVDNDRLENGDSKSADKHLSIFWTVFKGLTDVLQFTSFIELSPSAREL